MLQELSCPNCGAPGLEPAEGDRVVCKYCGNLFAESRTFCPHCQHVNPKDVDYCENCGEALVRSCPACDHKNWSGAEYCGNCGRPLDALESLAFRHRYTTAARLRETQKTAHIVKAEEEAASKQRLGVFWEAERERQQSLAEAAARQRARDRATLQMIVIGVVVFGLILLIAAIVLALK